jgi:hypothetical protein
MGAPLPRGRPSSCMGTQAVDVTSTVDPDSRPREKALHLAGPWYYCGSLQGGRLQVATPQRVADEVCGHTLRVGGACQQPSHSHRPSASGGGNHLPPLLVMGRGRAVRLAGQLYRLHRLAAAQRHGRRRRCGGRHRGLRRGQRACRGGCHRGLLGGLGGRGLLGGLGGGLGLRLLGHVAPCYRGWCR